MSLSKAILDTWPTSYWPLDDGAGSETVRNVKNLHSGTVPASGVTLSTVPFGKSLMPLFDGTKESLIKIPDDDCYSHIFRNSLTVACWICPHALTFRNTDGTAEQYVHFIDKGKTFCTESEWAMRLFCEGKTKSSRLCFYLFNNEIPHTPNLGAGAYMEYGGSTNDNTKVEIGKWLFVVGQGEPWVSGTDKTTGAKFFKQGNEGVPTVGDKYNAAGWNIVPWNGDGGIAIGGSIKKTAFFGSIAHVAVWNRLLRNIEITDIWTAGLDELLTVPTIAI